MRLVSKQIDGCLLPAPIRAGTADGEEDRQVRNNCTTAACLVWLPARLARPRPWRRLPAAAALLRRCGRTQSGGSLQQQAASHQWGGQGERGTDFVLQRRREGEAAAGEAAAGAARLPAPSSRVAMADPMLPMPTMPTSSLWATGEGGPIVRAVGGRGAGTGQRAANFGRWRRRRGRVRRCGGLPRWPCCTSC